MTNQYACVYSNEWGKFIGLNYFLTEEALLSSFLDDKQNCAIFIPRNSNEYQELIQKQVMQGARVTVEKWNDEADKLIFIFKEIPHDELKDALIEFVSTMDLNSIPKKKSIGIAFRAVAENGVVLIISMMLVKKNRYIVEIIDEANGSIDKNYGFEDNNKSTN